MLQVCYMDLNNVCSHCSVCVCVVQHIVLVSDILLDVVSELRFELLALGGALVTTDWRREERNNLN